MPQSIIEAIVAISNSERCAQAFRRHGLRPPVEIVREPYFTLAGRGVLGPRTSSSTSRAARLLRWTPRQVDDARNSFDRIRGYFGTGIGARGTGDYSYQGIPTVVFHEEAINRSRILPRDIATHSFIHLGGQPGVEGGEHDLDNYGPYDEILEACR